MSVQGDAKKRADPGDPIVWCWSMYTGWFWTLFGMIPKTIGLILNFIQGDTKMMQVDIELKFYTEIQVDRGLKNYT